MASAPRVSVVMNCLNGERHLQAALDSLRAQTFQDFEIVFWDNCSTDRSPAMARAYGPKLRYFRGESVVPLGAGRNLAIARCGGDFVAFLDCDDLWEPAKLERQLALFEERPELGLVTTDTAVFDGTRTLRLVFQGARPARGRVFEELVERQWISMSSAMLRREALASLTGGGPWEGGWFDESLNVCEEADVFYRVAHDWELDYVDEPLTWWRVHPGSTTFRRFEQFAAETRRILQKHEELWPGHERRHPELCALLRRRADFQEALSLWQRGRGAEGRRLLRPYGLKDRKMLAFALASLLPGSLFNAAARLYFALPRLFGRGR